MGTRGEGFRDPALQRERLRAGRKLSKAEAVMYALLLEFAGFAVVTEGQDIVEGVKQTVQTDLRLQLERRLRRMIMFDEEADKLNAEIREKVEQGKSINVGDTLLARQQYENGLTEEEIEQAKQRRGELFGKGGYFATFKETIQEQEEHLRIKALCDEYSRAQLQPKKDEDRNTRALAADLLNNNAYKAVPGKKFGDGNCHARFDTGMMFLQDLELWDPNDPTNPDSPVHYKPNFSKVHIEGHVGILQPDGSRKWYELTAGMGEVTEDKKQGTVSARPEAILKMIAGQEFDANDLEIAGLEKFDDPDRVSVTDTVRNYSKLIPDELKPTRDFREDKKRFQPVVERNFPRPEVADDEMVIQVLEKEPEELFAGEILHWIELEIAGEGRLTLGARSMAGAGLEGERELNMSRVKQVVNMLKEEGIIDIDVLELNGYEVTPEMLREFSDIKISRGVTIRNTERFGGRLTNGKLDILKRFAGSIKELRLSHDPIVDDGYEMIEDFSGLPQKVLNSLEYLGIGHGVKSLEGLERYDGEKLIIDIALISGGSAGGQGTGKTFIKLKDANAFMKAMRAKGYRASKKWQGIASDGLLRLTLEKKKQKRKQAKEEPDCEGGDDPTCDNEAEQEVIPGVDFTEQQMDILRRDIGRSDGWIFLGKGRGDEWRLNHSRVDQIAKMIRDDFGGSIEGIEIEGEDVGDSNFFSTFKGLKVKELTLRGKGGIEEVKEMNRFKWIEGIKALEHVEITNVSPSEFELLSDNLFAGIRYLRLDKVMPLDFLKTYESSEITIDFVLEEHKVERNNQGRKRREQLANDLRKDVMTNVRPGMFSVSQVKVVLDNEGDVPIHIARIKITYNE